MCTLADATEANPKCKWSYCSSLSYGCAVSSIVHEHYTTSRCFPCRGRSKTSPVNVISIQYTSRSLRHCDLIKGKVSDRLLNGDTCPKVNTWKGTTGAIKGRVRPEYLFDVKQPINSPNSTGASTAKHFRRHPNTHDFV